MNKSDIFKHHDISLDRWRNPTNEDVRIAVGILLLDMAGRDGDFDPDEVKTIFKTMCNQFHISENETKRILEMASEVRESREKIDSFLLLLRTNFSEAQRITVLRMIWEIVLADGKVAAMERRFADVLRVSLGLEQAAGLEAEKLARTGNTTK